MTPALLGQGSVRYSSIRAGNGKWALLEQPNGFINLHSVADGQLVRQLPRAIRSDTQAVFSRTSPDHVITVEENQIWQTNLAGNGESEVVASFPEYVKLAADHAEGDLSPDSYLALCGVREDGSEEV